LNQQQQTSKQSKIVDPPTASVSNETISTSDPIASNTFPDPHHSHFMHPAAGDSNSANHHHQEQFQHQRRSLHIDDHKAEYELFPMLEDKDIYSPDLYAKYLESYIPLYDRVSTAVSTVSTGSPSTDENEKHSTMCNVLAKDCLKWSGLNIRFQLFDRLTGFLALQSRISHFTYLHSRFQMALNPEVFDYTNVADLHGKVCEGDPMELPLTVARLKDKDVYCLEEDELHAGTEVCYPMNQHNFAFGNLCH
jgi:hypothetical protein